MSVRRFNSVIACLALTAFSLVAQAPSPHKSPEFSIDQSSGEEILLSSLKGKVVVMEFMFVGSAHCLHIAEMLNKLQADLGSRGFQAIAVAFGPHADQAMVGFDRASPPGERFLLPKAGSKLIARRQVKAEDINPRNEDAKRQVTLTHSPGLSLLRCASRPSCFVS